MHYTGTIWRPPYEAASLLLEVTAGCTHHKCKFCTLYNDLPFKFRMSPLEDIECDLQEVKRAMKGWNSGRIDRVFLTGANPFVLRQWELPMRTSFTGNCRKTRKSCWYFSMKSLETSVKKNYSGIEEVSIICKSNILWVYRYVQRTTQSILRVYLHKKQRKKEERSDNHALYRQNLATTV